MTTVFSPSRRPSRRTLLRCSSLSALALTAGPLRFGSRVGSPAGLRVVEIAGDGRTRGRAHGEELRGLIRGASERWRESLSPPGNEKVEDYVRRFVTTTSFQAAIEKHTPDLLEEVRGIAEGAGLPFETVFGMQLPDEEWWFSINARLGGGSPRKGPADTGDKGDKCTVVGVPPGGERPTLLAQNLDLPRWPAEAMVVLRIAPEGGGPEVLAVTIAGLVGANGINSAGVAVCVNTLLQLDNSTKGLPVAFVVRGVLERKSLDAASEFVREVPHASGQAYSLGGREGIVCLEASAGKVVQYVPAASDGRIVHTNHPLANDDRGLIGRSMRESDKDNSHVRFACAGRRAESLPDEIGAGDLESILSSHDSDQNPICNHLGERGGFTAASTVFEIGAEPCMRLAGTPPCEEPYAELRF